MVLNVNKLVQFDFLLSPPSHATNKVIPKQIRKAPVDVETLYKSARLPVRIVIKTKISITINLNSFILNPPFMY